MKKSTIIFFLLVLGTSAVAQPKIGLTFSPSLVLNRVKFDSDQAKITNNGSGIKFKFGLNADFEITDTYSFSTGIIYAPKRVGLTIEPTGSSVSKEVYKSQYLQIPLTIKLFTSEVAPDVKGFFQLGVLAEVKIFSEALDDSYTLVEKFKPYDASFVFGIGAEHDSGASSVLYAAIVYNRGLINTISKVESGITDNLITKLDMISLQLGIKF
ncbi:porin family protein [Reichenbachiella sp. MALMAid0571]|uniref:porin family protein n=1 Tax=Reichenbachiella sp. MALMAid0571 TaxID=3143939 RepID=UPI0032DFCB76